MFAYIIRRLVYGVVTLLALSIVVFFLIQAGGGSPLDRLRGNPRMVQMIPALTEHFGLDRPAWEQYLTWLKNFVTPVDVAAEEGTFVLFGKLGIRGMGPLIAFLVAGGYTAWAMVAKINRSWWRTFRAFTIIGVWLAALWFSMPRLVFELNWSQSFRGDGDVWGLIFGAVGATFRLGLTALFLALLIGIPLGIYQAIRQYSFFDQLGTIGAFVAFSMPIFIIAVGLQLILALYLERWTGVKLFYVTGMTSTNYSDLSFMARLGDIFQHLALPALSIALISTAAYSRFQRASMLEVMHSDYLRTAKAKGLPRRRIIVKHALRNALIPIVTLVALDIATIVGGAIITESIFGWPGIGRRYIDAIRAVDYPVVMAVVMCIGIGIVVMNIIADILYGVLDPRVRYD